METLDLQVIKNKKSVAQLVNGNIFYIRYLPNVFVEISDLIETYEAYKSLGENQSLRVLIELGEYSSGSKEAREYGQQNELPAISEAIVIHSLSQRIIFNFYLKFRKQKHPIKIFKTKENALLWLKKF